MTRRKCLALVAFTLAAFTMVTQVQLIIRSVQVTASSSLAEHSSHYPQTAAPAQQHEQQSTGSAPPPQQHEQQSTGSAAAAQQHEQQSTGSAPPPQQHEQQSTGSAAAAQQHEQQSTGSAAPAQQHEQQSTGSAAPAQQHEQQSTGSAPPPQQHEQQSTGSAAPSQQHEQQSTTSAAANNNSTAVCSQQRPDLGTVAVFVAFVTESYQTHYGMAQQTLRCYIERTGYQLFLVDLKTDPVVEQNCKHKDLFYRKHCAASVYAVRADWLLVLDADTGIVNPAHCIHEYIDPAVDIILYERFFNWEIASGNYIFRNTPFARKWLMAWADYEFTQPRGFSGADNGALQIHVMKTVLPEALNEIATCEHVWHKAVTYDDYMEYVTCCKVFRGASYQWPDAKIKLFKRGHGWVIDWVITSDRFCPANFMFHGWKANAIGDGGWESPFTRPPNGSDCAPEAAWPHRPDRVVSCQRVRSDLQGVEASSGRDYPETARRLPWLHYQDVAHCWPNCHKATHP